MSGTIAIVIDGKEHTGAFAVDRGVLTVAALEGRKAAQVGDMPPDILAKRLLAEIIRDAAQARAPGLRHS